VFPQITTEQTLIDLTERESHILICRRPRSEKPEGRSPERYRLPFTKQRLSLKRNTLRPQATTCQGRKNAVHVIY
jgi:hypothetical protein